jgi:hypothetical protein
VPASPKNTGCCGIAFITDATDSGMPLRDVQEASSRTDPRTTLKFDRARALRDRQEGQVRQLLNAVRPPTELKAETGERVAI